jgi:hypothetical protein
MNPFSISSRSKDNFCNRTKEIAKLQEYMRSGIHAVVYAPRRFGKSSLAGMVQSGLTDMENIYVELFSVTSLDEVAKLLYYEIANALGREAVRTPALLQRLSEFFSRVRFSLTFDAVEASGKINVSLGDASPHICLKEVISCLDAYCKKNGRRVCLILDEFQEICGLKESKQIEAFLREGMQRAEMVSFIFMGSRRTILRDMFENKKRPFYKSAIKFELERMPHDEFSEFIAARFLAAGRPIDHATACEIVSYTDGYAYYTQKLAMLHFDLLETGAAGLDISKAELINSEESDYENIFVNLAANQKKVLKAVARKPTATLYASDYLRENYLGAASSAKTAVEKLRSLDLIENRNGLWRTVDPILEKWVRLHSM